MRRIKTALDLSIANDPDLVRLERHIRTLHEVAELDMAVAEQLSKDPAKLLERGDSFLRLAKEVTKTIALANKLQQEYQRRREALEAERERRLATARAAFLAEGSAPGTTRH
ncbi:hypothetical protein [Inquilinus limosus]|uniref:Uncharacterized protein n=1 Tax=Inquilinus limosus MP06 TaxID=1398085 RepID=A0A0A0D582_9PROT|nr:hypothetical protein [Inquilinus limosus]KGM32978.1 hypothetical protein P409_18350 [Inquilinus limosus MP06]